MANKKVAPVLGGKKHPRFKLVDRIQTLAWQLDYALQGCSRSPARADKRQKALDEAIAEYLAWTPMKSVEHERKLKAEKTAKKAADRAARRTKEKLRKEKARAAQKKRDAAARARAKREKIKAAKAAKKAPKLHLVPNPPFFGSTPAVG